MDTTVTDITNNSNGPGAALLAKYDELEADRDAQMAWVNALPAEDRYVFAQALGARSFERMEAESKKRRKA